MSEGFNDEELEADLSVPSVHPSTLIIRPRWPFWNQTTKTKTEDGDADTEDIIINKTISLVVVHPQESSSHSRGIQWYLLGWFSDATEPGAPSLELEQPLDELTDVINLPHYLYKL